MISNKNAALVAVFCMFACLFSMHDDNMISMEVTRVKKDRGGEILLMLLPYLVAPIGFAIGHFCNVDWDKYGFIVAVILGFCLLGGTFAIGMALDSVIKKLNDGDDSLSDTKLFIIALAISVALACVLMQPFKIKGAEPQVNKATSSRSTNVTYSSTSTAASYQRDYPMVWGYIKNNADDPYEYIEYYHKVWGRLQKYTGDGINFNTLTRYEQSLINYPTIGYNVYFATPSSTVYHSTSQCYTLLKSDPISRPSSKRYNYDPCSKCVGQ